MSSSTRNVAPKHRKPSRHRTPALWVGGFLLLGLLVAAVLWPEPDVAADPLDQPDFVSGADARQRSVDAGNVSRDLERTESLPTRYQVLLEKQRLERVEERQQLRIEARKEARAEARREAADQAQQEVTSVVASPSPGTSSKPTTPSGGMPALLQAIRSHESGGNYSAYNASGCEGYGCGGAYQLHAAYASEWAARAGYPGLSGQAQTWAPATQDAVALHLFYSTNPDGAHWCSWVLYC